MTHRAAARRYARALFDVALREADPQQVERDLSAFVDLVGRQPELQRALYNPVVPASRKRGVVEALVRVAGPIPSVLAKLLLLLAERDRLALLPDLAEAYRVRLLDHRRVVRAEVTTAVALPVERVRALTDSLAQATGREVLVDARVDPTLIGGVVARVGSIVVDGSVARQLERMRERLAGGSEAASRERGQA